MLAFINVSQGHDPGIPQSLKLANAWHDTELVFANSARCGGSAAYHGTETVEMPAPALHLLTENETRDRLIRL
jgi:hypothetical protein